jgi:hypothetical protein
VECVAVIACSAAVIFARLAMIQDLNPFLWGFLAVLVYAGAPVYVVYGRGAGLMEAPWIWASSFGGLFVLFIIQAVVAAIKRQRNR